MSSFQAKEKLDLVNSRLGLLDGYISKLEARIKHIEQTDLSNYNIEDSKMFKTVIHLKILPFYQQLKGFRTEYDYLSSQLPRMKAEALQERLQTLQSLMTK